VLLLYKELASRHIFQRLSPSVKDRVDSFKNYTELFSMIIGKLLYMRDRARLYRGRDHLPVRAPVCRGGQLASVSVHQAGLHCPVWCARLMLLLVH